MGFTTTHINATLNRIFAPGNTIHLLSGVPDDQMGTTVTRVSGVSYKPYVIQEGDFTVSGTTVRSADHLIFYICNETDGHGEAVGFGVYTDNGLEYWGEFDEPMQIRYNTCPTIKKYDVDANEGLYISATSTSTRLSDSTE